MKKILFILVFFSAVLFIRLYSNFVTKTTSPLKTPESSSTATPTPTPILKQTTEVMMAGKNYQVSWIKVSDLNRLSLYSNLAEKKTTEGLKKTYSCQNLINAGFYDKSDHHLGLFVSGGKIINSELISSLFNGFFFITTDGIADIANSAPRKSLHLALQSGPLLWNGGNPQVLLIKNDELARRMVVLTTPKKEVYFLAIYDQDSPLQGPYLEDLPNLLLQFQKNTSVSITSALNLDGGGASAFSNQEVTLLEVTSVGSIFCLK
ncbi:phosphodiester glycosidase family protein [Candidatus Gottesmanbacteria bacterium]|nr:phosphodiester glycosidase family protein [Candidatus Gottesmanbacteria bacterium]